MGGTFIKWNPSTSSTNDGRFQFADGGIAAALRVGTLNVADSPDREDVVKGEDGATDYRQIQEALLQIRAPTELLNSLFTEGIFGAPSYYWDDDLTALRAPEPIAKTDDTGTGTPSRSRRLSALDTAHNGFFRSGFPEPIAHPDRLKEVIFWAEQIERVNGHFIFTSPVRDSSSVSSSSPGGVIQSVIPGITGDEDGFEADGTTEARGIYEAVTPEAPNTGDGSKHNQALANEMFEIRKAISHDIWITRPVDHRDHFVPNTGDRYWAEANWQTETSDTTAIGGTTNPEPWVTDPPASPGSGMTVPLFERNIRFFIGHVTSVFVSNTGGSPTINDGTTFVRTYRGIFSCIVPKINAPVAQAGAGLDLAVGGERLYLWMWEESTVDDGDVPGGDADNFDEIRVYSIDEVDSITPDFTSPSAPTAQELRDNASDVLWARAKTLVGTIDRSLLAGSTASSPVLVSVDLTAGELDYDGDKGFIRHFVFIDNLTDDELPDEHGPNSHIQYLGEPSNTSGGTHDSRVEAEWAGPGVIARTIAQASSSVSGIRMKTKDAFIEFP